MFNYLFFRNDYNSYFREIPQTFMEFIRHVFAWTARLAKYFIEWTLLLRVFLVMRLFIRHHHVTEQQLGWNHWQYPGNVPSPSKTVDYIFFKFNKFFRMKIKITCICKWTEQVLCFLIDVLIEFFLCFH